MPACTGKHYYEAHRHVPKHRRRPCGEAPTCPFLCVVIRRHHYFLVSKDPGFDQVRPFQRSLVLLTYPPLVREHASFLKQQTCFRLTLYFPCPSHFSKDPWFFLLGHGIQKPRSNRQVCSLLLEYHSFSLGPELGKVSFKKIPELTLIPPIQIQYHQVLSHLSFRHELGSQQINTLIPFLCPLYCSCYLVCSFLFCFSFQRLFLSILI